MLVFRSVLIGGLTRDFIVKFFLEKINEKDRLDDDPRVLAGAKQYTLTNNT